jgi:hypothetical protein
MTEFVTAVTKTEMNNHIQITVQYPSFLFGSSKHPSAVKPLLQRKTFSKNGNSRRGFKIPIIEPDGAQAGPYM